MSAAGSELPGDGRNLASTTSVVVRFENTVAAIVPGMPPVAATPYLVEIAETACSDLVLGLVEPGQITVGRRVVIDHLGASKVGANLLIHAELLEQKEGRYEFSVRIEDGDRVVARIEHRRVAVSLQRLLSSLQ